MLSKFKKLMQLMHFGQLMQFTQHLGHDLDKAVLDKRQNKFSTVELEYSQSFESSVAANLSKPNLSETPKLSKKYKRSEAPNRTNVMNNSMLSMLSRLKRPQKIRPLTDAEVQMVTSVFGDQLDVSNVRLKSAWWVLKGYAVSPNGNIYFNDQDWIEDFTKVSLSKQGWLIHELTHVWQLQQGIKVVRGALFDRRYRYKLKQGKSFFKYGIEQQARMVQDYFIRREMGKDCKPWQACIPFLQQQKP